MDTTTERTVVHGLRHRETGKLIRVRSETVVLQDEPYYNEDTTYHMTLDEGHPVFDAGSPEVLAAALLPRSGPSEDHPNPGTFTVADVEPVRIETVVTRSLAPLDLALERTALLPYAMAHDLNRVLAKSIPDFAPYLDALAEHQAELSAGNEPGADYPLDKARLVVLAVPQAAHELEDLVGGIATQSGGMHRRVVGVVDMPEDRKWMHLASRRGVDPDVACFLVCLQDKRPVTEAFLEQVSGRSAGLAP